ncbi:MAG TPA: serine hydrolase domain-containing protein [Candidatus Limnocylindria bacterium]|nr:serine hydrolase domain-containing protein [Candidatus Limnocylindria bacterium]
MRPAATLLCALLAVACSGPQPSPAAEPPPLTTLPPPALASPPPALPTPFLTAAPTATRVPATTPPSAGPPSDAASLALALEGLLDDWLVASRAPGAVLGLRLADGQTVVVAGGQTDDAGGFPVEADHRFRIGSITKTFVAALLVRLAGEGLLGLDDVLALHVPWAPHAERVTVRQLLSHTSGMPDFAAEPAYRQGLLLDPGRVWTARETVEFVAERELDFDPGTEWAYSNTNYTLAGLVAEAVVGEPLADLLRDRIAAPAGLADTYLEGLEDSPPIETAGHYDIDGDGDLENVRIIPYTGLVTSGAAAGGLSSTAADVLAFAVGLAGGQLLDATQLEELTAPAPGSPAYGLGVGLFRREGRDLWGHAGGLPGYTALLVHVPADGASAVVLVNASGVDVQSLIGDALRLALE